MTLFAQRCQEIASASQDSLSTITVRLIYQELSEPTSGLEPLTSSHYE